jgi:hypothetical protein
MSSQDSEQPTTEIPAAEPSRIRTLAERAADMQDALSDWLEAEHPDGEVSAADFSARVRLLMEAWVPHDGEGLRQLLSTQPEMLALTVADVRQIGVRAQHREGPSPMMVWLVGRLGLEPDSGFLPWGDNYAPSPVLIERLKEAHVMWPEALREDPNAVRGALHILESDPSRFALAMVRQLASRQLGRELGKIGVLRRDYNRLAKERQSRELGSELSSAFEQDFGAEALAGLADYDLDFGPDAPEGFEDYRPHTEPAQEESVRRPRVDLPEATPPKMRPMTELVSPSSAPPEAPRRRPSE